MSGHSGAKEEEQKGYNKRKEAIGKGERYPCRDK